MKIKIKRWSLLVSILLIFCSACNPDDYNPGEDYDPDYPENATLVENNSY